MKMIKCMEKFKLRSFFSFNKLNIIYKEYINRSIFISKILTCRGMFIFAVSNGINYFVCKSFACNINDLFGLVVLQNIVGDGVHQRGFTESGTSIYKKRVVSITGFFGYFQRCSMGIVIVVADNKSVKGVVWVNGWVQPHFFFFFFRHISGIFGIKLS